ncbi:MAG: DUF523 domain-containing protein [Candidatus Aenigmarchaeota archaeon]|nr:DUF523 domain-containing protein [Candidatus Aenigmarchaeota archaeon]
MLFLDLLRKEKSDKYERNGDNIIRPILLISACLEFEKVRYNGQSIPSKIIRDLKPFVEFIKVCPEYEIGLGVPREPIRIVKVGNEYRLIQHKTNRDVTDDINSFSQKFINGLKDVDGFIFKSKSPTMGITGIKVYSGMKGSPVIDKCGGFFASRIAEIYKGYPIEEDDRLRNKKIREHFLTKLFLFARYRNAVKLNRLEEFQEKNKLIFEFYNSKLSKKLDISKKDYFEIIKQIMSKPPSSEEIYIFFRKLIGEKEQILEKYKKNRISFETLKEVSKILINDKRLLEKTFFNIYPEGLVADVEEDRNKDYWRKT